MTAAENRVKKLQQKLVDEAMDSFLILNPENRLYYSGFSGSNGWLIVTREKSYLITDGRYFEQVRRESPHCQLVKAVQSYSDSSLQALIDMDGEGLLGEGVGFESCSMTVNLYNKIKKSLPDVELLPADDLIETPRDFKDSREIDLIRHAVKVAEEGFRHIEGLIVPGNTERQLAAQLQYQMKLAGADKEAFDIIVASGENSALPHAQVSDRVLKEGDPLVIDWGAKVDGYHSDMTRTLFVGEPGDKMREIYHVVLQAHNKAIEAIGPGKITGDIDAIARGIIEEAGYGEYFGHGLGHGVGLQIHENPRLKKDEDAILKPGMAVTVEPGIYIPGLGGVRIEDLVVITPEGREILTSLPIIEY